MSSKQSNSGLVLAAVFAAVVLLAKCGPDPPPPGPEPPPPVPVDGRVTIVVLRDLPGLSPDQAAVLWDLRERTDAWYAQDSAGAASCLYLEPDAIDEHGNKRAELDGYVALAGDLPWVVVTSETGGQTTVAKSAALPLQAETVLTWAAAPQLPDRAAFRPLNPADLLERLDLDFTIAPPGKALGFLGFGRGPPGILSLREAEPDAIIPRSEWGKWIDTVGPAMIRTMRFVNDQDGEGACVGFSGVNCTERAIHLSFGDRYAVRFSGESLYKRIGRSASSGANIGAGVEESLARGVLPIDSAENQARYSHTFREVGFRTPLPDGWESTARQFKSVEWVRITDKEEWFSALVRGYGGIWYGRQRHAIMSLAPSKKANRYYFAYENSWGDWGDPNGVGYDSESLISGLSGYALRRIVVRREIHIPRIDDEQKLSRRHDRRRRPGVRDLLPTGTARRSGSPAAVAI